MVIVCDNDEGGGCRSHGDINQHGGKNLPQVTARAGSRRARDELGFLTCVPANWFGWQFTGQLMGSFITVCCQVCVVNVR